MRGIICCLLLLAGCGTGNECKPLPRVSYDFVLVNTGPESFFCWTQDHILDMTTDETLAASFADTCHITLTRACDSTSALQVVCTGVNLSCVFDADGLGSCVNDLEAIVCKYDAWLDPLPK